MPFYFTLLKISLKTGTADCRPTLRQQRSVSRKEKKMVTYLVKVYNKKIIPSISKNSGKSVVPLC